MIQHHSCCICQERKRKPMYKSISGDTINVTLDQTIYTNEFFFPKNEILQSIPLNRKFALHTLANEKQDPVACLVNFLFLFLDTFSQVIIKILPCLHFVSLMKLWKQETKSRQGPFFESSVKKSEELIILPISLLFSFAIHSDMTSGNVLPICLMQLSVI